MYLFDHKLFFIPSLRYSCNLHRNPNSTVLDDVSQPIEEDSKIGVKKRKSNSDSCSIKSEPYDDDDDVKVVAQNNEVKLDCQFCGCSFETVSDLQTHTLRDHIPMPVPSLECQHCCAVLPSFAAFVLHMRGHLSDRDENRCPRCPLTFSDGQVGPQKL
ncbi:unnamed protein product [Cylicostephanus goldi]|uniref:C2H2-type domain-containing protein n=1 Tax=Cylicostephanus goldi TaxID=71465 RepID=A0A3P6SV29_CYLGO|nr:unnamed protein product [Cylicostephanus goldi]